MITPLIDPNVRDAKHGQRVQLADGSEGTVVSHRFCHLNVDAAVYRKVIWVNVSNQQRAALPWLDPHVENTLGESWYRTHVCDDQCLDVAIDYYEV
jgi:hypothetical protein